MKKIFSLFLLFLFCVLGCMPGESISTKPPQTVLRIGFCPTMQEEINHMTSDDYALEKVRYANSAQVIQALNAGEVHAALIGRKPYPNELFGEMTVRQLQAGVTLVTLQQRVVPYEELSNYSIHTFLSPEIVKRVLPDDSEIVYHTEADSTFTLDLESAVLVYWSQVTNDYQLLVPVDGQGNKIRAFRTPFLIFPGNSQKDFEGLIDDVLRSIGSE